MDGFGICLGVHRFRSVVRGSPLWQGGACGGCVRERGGLLAGGRQFLPKALPTFSYNCTMKTIIPLTICLLLTSQHARAQKVANFSVNEIGTSQFEEFSFWVKEGKRSDIDYSYGKNYKTLKLVFAGECSIDEDKGFKVKFPNGLHLCVVAKGEHLLVSDSVGKYMKLLDWHYEGPVNGIGTFCTPCAEDEKEAIQLVRKYYLQ